MKNRGVFPGIATVDVLLSLLFVFLILLELSLLTINAEDVKQNIEHLKSTNLFVIKVDWSGDSKDDVDTYIGDSYKHLVYFRRLQDGFMTLERDDTGQDSNTLTLPDGRRVVAANNEEVVDIRGILEGEYTINVHMYHKASDTPTKVIVSLYKIADNQDVLVHQKVLTLTFNGEEQTAFRFTLTRNGEVVDVNELREKFIGVDRRVQ
jgi:hypothetical protein